MFNDHQDNQGHGSTDIDHVAKDISTDSPSMGLGTNPSTFSPVMPPQASAAPPPPSGGSSDDSANSSDTPAPPALQVGNTIHPAAASQPSSDLSDIKDQALQQLSPLIGKLDQPPEERFKTLMMMIQASDNHELIREAYEAANSIPDETLKAEALLAVVNEINYFTQQKSGS